MKHTLQEYVKKREGISHTTEVLIALPFLLGVLFLILCVLFQWSAKNQLDNFAYEMAMKAGTIGQCQGTELNTRYEQLAAAYGIRPVMSISSNSYFNSAAKSVQYGDAITVKLTMQRRIFGFNGISLPFSLEAAKITQSMTYWK